MTSEKQTQALQQIQQEIDEQIKQIDRVKNGELSPLMLEQISAKLAHTQTLLAAVLKR